jgi:hypothetical protein
MNDLLRAHRLGGGLLSLALVVSACSATGAPTVTPTGSPSPPVSPPADAPASPPSGTPVSPPPSDGAGNGSDPGLIGGGGKLVFPKPGQLDVHPVPIDALAARVDGHRIVVTAAWTSGVEPCNVLDTVEVHKGEGTYTITLFEGTSARDVACIAIAEQHRTEFEIPDVAAGTWRILDGQGLAAPIDVTVG